MTPIATEETTHKQSTGETDPGALYESHVNPDWVRLLDVLGMKATYSRCEGVELTTSDGRRILDFLSGYCVYNTGHNHPAIIAELEQELRRCRPTMLQSHVPELAAELAAKLCALAGGGLRKTRNRLPQAEEFEAEGATRRVLDHPLGRVRADRGQ